MNTMYIMQFYVNIHYHKYRDTVEMEVLCRRRDNESKHFRC